MDHSEGGSSPIATGMVTSIGIPAGLGIIVLAISLTAFYVRRASRHYDGLVEVLQTDHGA